MAHITKFKIIMGIIAAALGVLIIVGIVGMFHRNGNNDHHIQREKLLIILLDGVRYDYVNNNNSELKGFNRLAAEGVKAEYNVPIYPANSYPNWYTIATGLYGESHGMVQNRMYDFAWNDFFLMSPHPNVSHPYWWNDAEPIWIRAEKSGIRTIMYNWDGCQVTIMDSTPTKCTKFHDSHNWVSVNNDTIEALRDILDEFESDNCGLGMVYYQPVDYNGHKYGPESENTRNAMIDASNILETLQNDIEIRDHGMSQPTKRIFLDQHIDFKDVMYMMDKGSLSMIFPENDSALNRMYRNLTKSKIPGLNVYLKNDIPEELHFKHNSRILPLVLRTDPGYLIEAPKIKGKVFPDEPITNIGNHGYYANDSDEMKGIMYAKGPSFKSKFIMGPINQIDHYQVFCHILGVEPKPNNGSWTTVKVMLN